MLMYDLDLIHVLSVLSLSGGARKDCANWCNPRDTGVGRLPTTAGLPDPRMDAVFWLKTPGESDGCTQTLPSGGLCPRFDSDCASIDSLGSAAGEPRAPEAGHWFMQQMKMLAKNADFGPELPTPTPTTAATVRSSAATTRGRVPATTHAAASSLPSSTPPHAGACAACEARGRRPGRTVATSQTRPAQSTLESGAATTTPTKTKPVTKPSPLDLATSATTGQSTSTHGPGCCSWDPLLQECGDHCGEDGSTWCHESPGNCAACSSSGWIAKGTPKDNCGSSSSDGGSSNTGGGSTGTEDTGSCAMPPGLPTTSPDVDNTGFATRHGKLKLVGNQLSDASGKAVQLMGMSSHGLHWFPDCYTKASIKYLVEHWGINIFRAALYVGEGGYASSPAQPKKLLQDIVQWCKELGIYVMIDWHVLTPGDPNHWLTPTDHSNAATWWKEMATLYKSESHVIYEIANEPNGVTWGQVKTYGDIIVAAIRLIDAETIIVCGTPTWSQDIHEASTNQLAQPHNVMYAFHFYAGTHMGLVQRVKDTAKLIPIFASEWGTSAASGDGGPYLQEAREFLDVFNDSDGAMGQTISWCQWSYADKDEKSAALTPNACRAQDWGSTSCSGTFLSHYIKAHASTA